MLKLYLVFLIVLYSTQLILVNCNDDEFAEFDELFPGEQDSIYAQHQQQQQQQQQHQNSQRRPSQPNQQKPNIVDKADSQTKDHVKIINDEREVGAETHDSTDEHPEDKQQKKPDLKLVNVPSFRQFKVESSAKNSKLAQDWYEQSRDLLKQQFALVGGSPTINDGAHKRDEESEAYLATIKKQKGLIKSSESLFTIWNSGRVGLEGLLVEINLLKRQDLFSMAMNLLKTSRDTLTLRFLLPQEGYENFVFCLAHKTQASKLARDMVDVNTFCPKRKSASLYGLDSEKILVMSELSDVSSFMFDQKLINFLKKYEKSINYIHITDRYSTDRSEDVSAMQKLAVPKRMATFSFQFPLNAETRQDYILFSLSLLDRLRKFKLARDSKQKSDKNRQKITDHLQKTAFNLIKEMAQAKKDERRRLEKERIYNEDDPEKQRKWEKKEAKREQKKNMRLKQLKVKSM